MNIHSLNILADAISDAGSWYWWLTGGDMVQVQFCDVTLYDENTSEKEPHSTDILAVRFRGNAFACKASALPAAVMSVMLSAQMRWKSSGERENT